MKEKRITTKRKILISIVIMMTVITTGCWDNRDLTEIALAVAVGLDKTPEGDIDFTVQLVKPGVIKAKAQGSTEKATWTYSATGSTIFSAIRNLLTTVNRKTFFSHIQLIVVGEEVAKEGLTDILDIFERDTETNRQSKIIIAKGTTAKRILKAQSELEDIPGMHITENIENNVAVGKIKNINLIKLLNIINFPGQSPAIGMIETVDGNNKDFEIKDLKVHGTAVFKKDKLVGWLDPIETRGLVFAQNQITSCIINVPNPLEKEKQVAMEVVRSQGRLDAELTEDKLKFIIEINAIGRIAHQEGRGDLTTLPMNAKLERAVTQVIKEDIKVAIEKCQQVYKTDIFGFSPIVHRKYHDFWKKNKENWSKVFCKSKVEIKVTYQNQSSGIIRQKTEAK